MKKIFTMMFLFGCLLACGAVKEKQAIVQASPKYQKSIYYDSASDDLLTAGLGLSGLRGLAPVLSETPSATALRQASYYHQFRALNDLTKSGGYGNLYGINEAQAPISGHEYWSQHRIKAGPLHTVVLQVPDDLNRNHPCLIIAPSSGSRNVLGAVGTSGAWALIQGCAVAYTDKGTGTEVALIDDKAYQIDGRINSNNAAGAALFSQHELHLPSPLHVVQIHPYSQENPEQYWGQFVLDAAQFGLGVLQSEYTLSRQQIHVIAASISNGGGAVLRAAEQDKLNLIDAVVAGEPQLNMRHVYQLKQEQNLRTIETKPLLKVASLLSLLEPCASLDKSLATAPFKANTLMIQTLLANRCQALADAGLVVGESVEAQAADALQKIQAIQIEPAALQLSHINTLASMWGAINHTYANSYLKKTAEDNLCQSAMSAFTAAGAPRVLNEKEAINMFALSNGIAPSNGVELAYTDDSNSIQSKMLLALNFGFLSQQCFYKITQSAAIERVLNDILARPQANQKPTIIVHGQADGTVAINHTSRAYFHKNQTDSQRNAQLRYYEIKHAQHFDAFLAYPGFKEQFVPMHPYFEQSMSMMLNHLRTGAPLAPSQVVPASPRNQEPVLSRHHIPGISDQTEHPISITNKQLVIQ